MIRKDTPYFRRRVKQGSVNAPKVASTSLKFGNASNEPISSIPLPKKVDGKVILTLEEPTVRLNDYQSGIGSLAIKNAQVFVWETYNGYGNLVQATQDTSAPLYGNRPLAEFHKGDIVMGLRHAKHLRRLIVGHGTGYYRVSLYDGSEVVADADNGNNVLILSRIGNQTEIRLEKTNNSDIIKTFSIQVMP